MLQIPKLSVINGKPTTTSNQIADYFGRNHFHVIRDIENVLAVCSKEFSASNFGCSEYKDSRGKIHKSYVLTRSGFAAIALAFTGKKAIDFRVAYIKRFDEMEAQLHSKELKKLELEYIKDRVLPFGEPVVRDYVSVGKAIFYIRMLGRLPELTNGKLKGMLVRGELEGFQNDRGHWQIYEDQITKLLGGDR